MRVENYMKRIVTVIIAIIAVISISTAQDVNEAVNAYNSGFEAFQAKNYEEALAQLEECIAIAEEIGEEADEVRLNAESLIPKTYYQIGRGLADQKKYKEAIKKFEETIKMAEYYGDNESKSKAEKYLPNLWYGLAIGNYKKGDFEGGLKACDNAIAKNEKFTKAFYMKTAIYKAMDDAENVKSSALKAIEVANSVNDKKISSGTKKQAIAYFLKKAEASKQANKPEEAITFLKTSLEFDDKNANAYMVMATIYFSQSKWQNAIDAYKNALQNKAFDPEKEAGLYFQIASAHQKLGNTGEACAAFKKAAVGAYKENAEYQMKNVLKCE